MSVLGFAIIFLIVLSIQVVVFSCLSASSKYDSAFESYMRTHTTTDIIEKIDQQ